MKFKWMKKTVLVTLSLVTLGATANGITASASSYNIQMNDNAKTAKAAYAFDMNDGHVFYRKNAYKRMPVASTAKLMTLYLAIQKAQSTRNGWNQKITMPNNLARMSQNRSLGSYKLTAGKQYTVYNLYRATVIASSNSAAIALGQWVAGSNTNFIKKMNHQARDWGLGRQATFVSASGLENSDLYGYGVRYGGYYAYNKVSAKALGIIASNVLKIYPDVVNTSKLYRAKQNGQWMHNTNELLKGGLRYYPELHVDGLKTGYTPLAGNTLVSTSQLPGKDRVIIVTLNDRFSAYSQSKMYKAIYKYSPYFNQTDTNRQRTSDRTPAMAQ
ncbi:D-alanyl-D-alanine carboxypeptidase family protein [Apilactobacillus timberlakei]|uniref:D-alanyl-D-alanine carboxypeptidase n=2 Tax=Apilactobacillus timberlakei TaxID=2008380 RepID=A0ABY2YT97_9LACO|nr:serine hydrolase [Apilactobacillus timberlakei]TPR13155.1 D-alanyl-D-alanine carboxypeptidase [Apilactobacillus timberlakei]TPR14205.1 D-alanyl-D-alanine carboxypeptidase [Apilactobacillus timberlakei]TPR16458.1 D-alanyl-D-alanine carboxypeptidase [Apilactobacillus timberlakei]TPR23340.1 D-alanyl-D-alanine carboxypeptidase [Apilactobacillus timberlakei]